jgi:DNA modification methylase
VGWQSIGRTATDEHRVMTPHYTDPWLTVYLGDCREVMAEMEPESVHCVVTSPPYWGLRDYGTAAWDGGDEACDHLGPPAKPSPKSTLGVYADGRTRYKDGWDSDKQEKKTGETTAPYRHACGKCGAIRQDGQLGLEPTPEAYVESMVAVFREVRRVLRSDGTVWLNLGDSYASDMKGSGGPTPKQASNTGSFYEPRKMLHGLKPKDLVGIPWRVAFALQADGWYLRSDIIWSKPNPMPESVTDRPTKAHEYLFLLSKSPRYYYDADAVKERGKPGNGVALVDADRNWDGRRDGTVPGKGEAHATGTRTGGNLSRAYAGVDWDTAGRNLRSVWNIATQPYPGAHFATFPPKLVEPCIKAGCPENGVVLDPFAGSGTTGMVAQSLSRRAVLIDLNADYLTQVMDRNRDMPLGLSG